MLSGSLKYNLILNIFKGGKCMEALTPEEKSFVFRISRALEFGKSERDEFGGIYAKGA